MLDDLINEKVGTVFDSDCVILFNVEISTIEEELSLHSAHRFKKLTEIKINNKYPPNTEPYTDLRINSSMHELFLQDNKSTQEKSINSNDTMGLFVVCCESLDNDENSRNAYTSMICILQTI